MKPEIIYLAKDRYTLEHNRYDQAAQKAGRIITVITLFIGILMVFVRTYAEIIFSPPKLIRLDRSGLSGMHIVFSHLRLGTRLNGYKVWLIQPSRT